MEVLGSGGRCVNDMETAFIEEYRIRCDAARNEEHCAWI